MKLIIDIPEEAFNEVREKEDIDITTLNSSIRAIENGTPLDSNSERAEVQAYFDGESFGWDEGREALIEELKAEIEHMACKQYEHRLTLDRQEVIDIFDNIGKAESEEQ